MSDSYIGAIEERMYELHDALRTALLVAQGHKDIPPEHLVEAEKIYLAPHPNILEPRFGVCPPRGV